MPPASDNGTVPLRWSLSWPLRWYVRHAPTRLGKGFLVRKVLARCLPPRPQQFACTLPGGGQVQLYYQEDLGLWTMLFGDFEHAEMAQLAGTLQAGSVVFDIGANVGVFTVELASRNAEARVLAFEPVPDNIARLEQNVARNALANVEILPLALADSEGTAHMGLSQDNAYATFANTTDADPQASIEVRMRRLDDVWEEHGRPTVAAMKIDVEGAEPKVLRGALQCLEHCRPLVLVEANDDEALAKLEEILLPLGYGRRQPAGFRTWNWLFEHAG